MSFLFRLQRRRDGQCLVRHQFDDAGQLRGERDRRHEALCLEEDGACFGRDEEEVGRRRVQFEEGRERDIVVIALVGGQTDA